MGVFDYLPADVDRTAAHELAQRIASNTWVLFPGAGVSMHSGLPPASSLVERLESDLGLSKGTLSRDDLASACSQYQHTKGEGREPLITFLRRELDTDGREPARLHDLLLDLGPKEILTTNPEDLWEKALKRRNIPFRTIVRGADWGECTDHQLPLVKLHGDLAQPDTLVFAEDDYWGYPRDEILSTHLRSLLSRKSFFFVGYSAGDQNLRREIQWVVDRLEGGSRSHFLLTDQIEDWRRRQFAGQNIQVIALGDYGRLQQFLSDLISEVNRLRPSRRLPIIAGLEAAVPGLHQEVLVELFQDRYEPIRAAIAEWWLSEAETGLREIIDEVERMTGRRPEIIEVLRDFQQRLLLALANVLHWRGHRQEALRLWDRVQAIGPLEPPRQLQAATFLANMADTHGLAQLLGDSPLEPSEHRKLEAILAWLEGNVEQAGQLIPDDTSDIDLAILKVRVTLATTTEETVGRAQHQLDRAWDLVQPVPMGMVQAAELTDALLRQVVSEGWHTPTLDRRELLRTIRTRYDQTVLAAQSFKDAFPEVLIEALSAAMQFHRYLDEEEAVAMYRSRLQTLPGMTRSRAVAEYLAEDGGAALETIDTLYREGYLSPAEKALLASRHLIEMGLLEQGEETLHAALATVANEAEREAILGSLLELLAERERSSEAEALLAQEQQVPSEFMALMRSLVVSRMQGRMAAIEHMRSWLAQHPNSRMVLHNLIRLLVNEARERRQPQSDAMASPDIPIALLQEARRYAERLVEILPSPEARFRLASVLAELEDFEGALRVLQEIVADGYVTRNLLMWQGHLLMRVQQPREAATILDGAVDRYPKDYNLALLCGSAWADAHEYGQAIARLEPLLEWPEASTDLFIGLGSTYLREAAADPSFASHAFDLFKRAFEQHPSEETLPMRLVMAGLASGRSREAWELIGHLDLSQSPYLRAMSEQEALPLLREQTAQLRQRQAQYEAGMIPFATFAEHASRPAWFLWWARMAVFQRSWQSEDHAGRPLLVDLPSIQSALGDVDSLPHGLLLDMTAVLTLGTLEVIREMLEVLRAAHCPVYLFPGCMRWLDREIVLLQTDQLPWYRERFRQLQELLQGARAVVEIKNEPASRDSLLSEIAREALGLIGVDLEHAILGRAYYLDDDLGSDQAVHLPGGVLISSAQALASMVGQGLIFSVEAIRVEAEHPGPFDNWAALQPVPLDRPVVIAEPTLLAWYEAGMLKRWVHGGEGWPKIMVGPWAWSSLSAHATEGIVYREALSRAEATRRALEEAMRLSFIQECPAAPSVSLELAGFQQAWTPAITLLASAKECNLAVWTDDLFLRLIMDRRGLLSEDAVFRPLEERVRGVFAGVVVAGTEGVLRWLARAGALPGEREGELVWLLMSHGYRVLGLRQVLRWWLQRVPYRPDSPAIRYRQLLRDLQQVVRWIPEGVGADRRALFARTTLVAITPGLIAEVWAVTVPGFSEAHRRHLAEALLHIFEEAMEG